MGRNDHPCPICGRNFKSCPHSWADREQNEQDERIRRLARQAAPAGLTVEQERQVRAIVHEILREDSHG